MSTTVCLRAENIRELVRDVPFPSRRGFEKHSYAYEALKKQWKSFRGPVRNLEHFILAERVQDLKTREVWFLCVECRERRTRLFWLTEAGMAHPGVQELML